MNPASLVASPPSSSPAPPSSTPAPTPRPSLVVPRTPVSADARAIIARALDQLCAGRSNSAPELRRAKLLADAAGDREASARARLCLALEEAMRGDYAVARRYADDAVALGATLPSVPVDASAVRCIIEARAAASCLARGERDLAKRAFGDAARHVRFDEEDAGDARLRVLASRALRDADPRSAWLVGPNAAWVEAPDGARVDLAKTPLLRRIWRCLVEAHLASPGSFVSARTLAQTLWPTMDPSSATVRNRMKVALFKMREAGLRGAIERTTEGLRLANGQFPQWRRSPRFDADSLR
ncbi:MAG: hypothetical protein KF819_09530 [Labilithrix sp.]|nr:hypothetical protein [Labilithrix sp.]